MERTAIPSSDGVHDLSVAVWRPAGQPVAAIQLLHGMRQHMGQYDDFARFMNQHGMLVCGHDQLGHGLTAQEHQDYGYFGPKNGPRFLVRDCHLITRRIRNEYPELPVFLFGHSMGSFVGRLYILQNAASLAGFICFATGSDLPTIPYLHVLTGALARFQGNQLPSNLLYNIAFSTHHKKFDKKSNRTAWLSRDLESGRSFANDPLSQFYFSNRGLHDFMELYMAASLDAWASKVNPELPILISSGSEDLMGSFGKGPIGVYEDLKKAGVRDVRCRLYPNARHELLSELNREEIFYDVLTWILQRIN